MFGLTRTSVLPPGFFSRFHRGVSFLFYVNSLNHLIPWLSDDYNDSESYNIR